MGNSPSRRASLAPSQTPPYRLTRGFSVDSDASTTAAGSPAHSINRRTARARAKRAEDVQTRTAMDAHSLRTRRGRFVVLYFECQWTGLSGLGTACVDGHTDVALKEMPDGVIINQHLDTEIYLQLEGERPLSLRAVSFERLHAMARDTDDASHTLRTRHYAEVNVGHAHVSLVMKDLCLGIKVTGSRRTFASAAAEVAGTGVPRMLSIVDAVHAHKRTRSMSLPNNAPAEAATVAPSPSVTPDTPCTTDSADDCDSLACVSVVPDDSDDDDDNDNDPPVVRARMPRLVVMRPEEDNTPAPRPPRSPPPTSVPPRWRSQTAVLGDTDRERRRRDASEMLRRSRVDSIRALSPVPEVAVSPAPSAATKTPSPVPASPTTAPRLPPSVYRSSIRAGDRTSPERAAERVLAVSNAVRHGTTSAVLQRSTSMPCARTLPASFSADLAPTPPQHANLQ